jgi:hypothetical protein
MTAPGGLTPEVALFWSKIEGSLARLVELVEGVDPVQRTWHPPAPDTNSLAGILGHVLANAEENICGVISGVDVAPRDRRLEFGAAGTGLAAAYRDLRPRLVLVLSSLSASELDRVCRHPRRGMTSVREVLLVVARHVAEHEGEATLTRSLLLAAAGPR